MFPSSIFSFLYCLSGKIIFIEIKITHSSHIAADDGDALHRRCCPEIYQFKGIVRHFLKDAFWVFLI